VLGSGPSEAPGKRKRLATICNRRGTAEGLGFRAIHTIQTLPRNPKTLDPQQPKNPTTAQRCCHLVWIPHQHLNYQMMQLGRTTRDQKPDYFKARFFLKTTKRTKTFFEKAGWSRNPPYFGEVRDQARLCLVQPQKLYLKTKKSVSDLEWKQQQDLGSNKLRFLNPIAARFEIHKVEIATPSRSTI